MESILIKGEWRKYIVDRVTSPALGCARERHPFPKAWSRLRSRGALAICMGCRFSGLETHTWSWTKRFSWLKPADVRATSEMYACVYKNEFVAPLNTLAKTIYPRQLDRREQEDKRTNTAVQAGYKIGRENSFAFFKIRSLSWCTLILFFFKVNLISLIDDYFRRCRLNFM